MTEITFSQDQKARMVSKIKAYFEDELQQEIGGFEAEFLIDFFATELGPHFYNRGLFDAQQVLTEKMDEVGYVMQELEKPEV
ncbi:MAG: hypothetical protein AOY29_02115 [Alcanivorax borkumensis]|jgi:uncharacterized protein (DUF2164 family)|uniref:DUF2164 domain-containing protein n=1 Tax=Alcanivorax borkumensis (strain ATCC 700651 / DSM 11573 / NCIMB 13689 / SK2) TaxID=393595 RepID=Q0VPB2_ALCBS|nr:MULTISPECIES: DUF2164 domain-containing protein [Alcanivorax]OJH08257.1 MAG: hypothetical protein AOY29_02115 [Alcanivorax borkumensis]BAP14441.1 hypothetical protein AS19_15900 [Alcanivorax sp. NBRC 101098]CAL16986.1 conserved hypothetical protein [Alcanivorax borkumensis SK2]